MNWTRIVIGGVVAGILTNLANYVMHGMIMANTYKKYDQVFSQTAANPLKFFAVAIVMWICVAVLFGKTRQSWAAGWNGGLGFGFFLGLASFFANFYHPLVIDGFPYHLAWCWGGIGLIGGLIGGAVLGALIPKQ